MPGPSDSSPRHAPAPVLATIVVLALALAVGLLLITTMIGDEVPGGTVLLGAAVQGGLTVGLWQGSRAAYVLTLGAGAVLLLAAFPAALQAGSAEGLTRFVFFLVSGALLLSLLLGPASARRYFA